VLRLTSLLDEDVCGFVDLAILGVIDNCAWGCFRPRADARAGRIITKYLCTIRRESPGAGHSRLPAWRLCLRPS
jgi:hypothetical protein